MSIRRARSEDVTDVLDALRVEQRDRGLVAETVDVERAASRKVEHRLPALRGTRHGVRAPPVDLTVTARQRGLALRALPRHHERLLAAVSEVDHRTDNLRDDVPGATDNDRVTDEHSLALHLVLVVQRRGADGHAADVHRLE